MDGPERGEGARRGSAGVLEQPAYAEAPATGEAGPLWAVVLAGGIGSRFWPLATPSTPKPVLALVDGRPLVADTVMRLDPVIPADRVLVVTSADIASAVRAALPTVPAHNVLVEERPLGTTAALAWGVMEVQRRGARDAVICATHADLSAAFPELFRAAIATAARAAAQVQALVAIGVRPTRAEPGFGYLEVDAADGDVADVVRFTEKPSADVAAQLVADGAFWHSGIVLGGVPEWMSALRLHAREVAPGLAALERGEVAAFAAAVEPVSLERALLERVGRLAMVAPEFGWDDVGTWASLRRVRELDDDGNGAHGRAAFADATGNVVHADAGAVVLYGVSRLLVVTRPGVTFVTTIDRAADLKPLLDALPGSARLDPGSLGRGAPPGGSSH